MNLLSVLFLIVVSYNTENLFYPEEDGSFTRYKSKEENLARVLTTIGEWDGVDVVGLQEVENAKVVKRLCYTLRRGEYDFVHYDSPDRRGIDVALIYKKARLDTLNTRAIKVNGVGTDGDSLVTRDILYVSALVDKRDTMHFFVCHLPSQRGGAAQSEWKRILAKRVLQSAIDSVRTIHEDAKIVVMGDMNSAPRDDLRGLTNRMNEEPLKTKGTHKYQGQWTCLDQFYLSPAVDSISTVSIFDAEWIQEPDEKYMGLKPKRTFSGVRYQNGYSDHLPIVLKIATDSVATSSSYDNR